MLRPLQPRQLGNGVKQYHFRSVGAVEAVAVVHQNLMKQLKCSLWAHVSAAPCASAEN